MAKGIGATESLPSAGEPDPNRHENEVDALHPQDAGLLTQFFPFDRSTMEKAIDRFLDQFDGLGTSLSDLNGPVGLFPASLGLIGAIVAVDIALRLWRRPEEGEGATDDEASLVRFPGLPGLRS